MMASSSMLTKLILLATLVVSAISDQSGTPIDVCPVNLPPIPCVKIFPPKNACKTDNECLTSPKTKCCSTTSCGRACFTPVQQNPSCPNAASLTETCTLYKDQCTKDSDCDSGKYCCLHSDCGRQCTPPATGTPQKFECPKAPFVRCLYAPYNVCENNGNCSPDKLCCNQACGKICTKPVAVGSHNPPPTSVPYPRCPEKLANPIACSQQHPPRSSCATDAQCTNQSSGRTCCAIPGCGRLCVPPINYQSPSCPNPSAFYRVCVRYHDQCTSDSKCGSGKFCCLVPGCGKECMSPGQATYYNLVCPKPANVRCAYVYNHCLTDANCSPSKMCCERGCGKRCSDPVKVPVKTTTTTTTTQPPNPSSCPNPYSFTDKSCSDFKTPCSYTTGCKHGKTCCYIAHCGHRCLDLTPQECKY